MTLGGVKTNGGPCWKKEGLREDALFLAFAIHESPSREAQLPCHFGRVRKEEKPNKLGGGHTLILEFAGMNGYPIAICNDVLRFLHLRGLKNPVMPILMRR
jgi:hypothetical protein